MCDCVGISGAGSGFVDGDDFKFKSERESFGKYI